MLKLCIKLKDKVYANSLQSAHRLTMANYEDNFTYPIRPEGPVDLWERIPLERKRKHDLRDVVDGIFWMLRTGSQWRNLPEKFPKWQVVYYYYRKWQRDGVLRNLTWKLNALFRKQKLKEPTPSVLSIDSQSVKSEGLSKGVPWTFGESPLCSRADGNKKVNGRKRHILTPKVQGTPLESPSDRHIGTGLEHRSTRC